MKITGIIKYFDFEGGFYGIIADDKRKYLPENLPKELEKDGLRATFDAIEINTGFSIQMWGSPIKITNYDIIK